MSEDPRTSRQIQVLRDLGLSRVESEVYVVCLGLGAGGGGALSSYRVAQEMGRDPANIGKIVNALVRLRAVRVVQEKPRLFVAVAPEDFTEQLLGRLRRSGAEAVSLLECIGSPASDGVAQAITDRDAALARIRELLGSCRRELLVMASPALVRELGADLEKVAERPDCRVRVASPKAFTSAVAEIAVLPASGRLGGDPGDDWVALAVDDENWLVVFLPQEIPDGRAPCGWWSAGSPVARILAECLESCWLSGARVGKPLEDKATEPAPNPDTSPIPVPAPVFAPFVPDTSGTPRVSPAGTGAPPAPATAKPKVRETRAGAQTDGGLPNVEAHEIDSAEVGSPDGDPPRTRPLSADQAEKAGFTFLFRHERKSDKHDR